MRLKLHIYHLANAVLRLLFVVWKTKPSIKIFCTREERRIGRQLRDGLLFKARMMGVTVGTLYMTYGAFYFSRKANYAVLYSLFVQPLFRRFGVGLLLVEESLKEAKSRGFEEVFCMCLEDNFVVHGLFRKSGFGNGDCSRFAELYIQELGTYCPKRFIGFYKTTKQKKGGLTALL